MTCIISGNRVVPRVIANASGNRTINLDLLLNQPSSTVNNNGTIVINGLISGTGNLFFVGSGTTEFTNNNTYSGATTIGGGTLKLTGTSSLGGGTYAKNLVINGVFEYSSSTNQTLSGVLDSWYYSVPGVTYNAASKIVVNGPGRLTLAQNDGSGAFPDKVNYFAGAVEINGGYLSVGNGQTLLNTVGAAVPSGGLQYVSTVTINANGTLEFNRGRYVGITDVSPVCGVITGTGAIRVMNLSALKFTGRNSDFAGTTTVDSGGQLELTRKLGGSIVDNGTLILSPTSVGSWNGLDPNFSATVGGSTTTYTRNTDYVVAAGSGENNVTAQIQDAGFGNSASEFTGFVSGRVALISRGVQSFQTKINNAVTAGASAVIIYNNTTGLTTPSISSSVPVFFITQALGEQLVADIAQGAVSINVDTGYEAGAFSLPEIFSAVSGTGSLAYGGTGTLTVNATPNITISGAFSANTGILRVTSSDAVPNATSFGVASGAALELIGGISHAKNLSVNGTGVSNGGVVRNISGNNTISGNTSLTAAARINSDADTLALNSGAITGAFAITFGGAGNISVGSAVNNSGTIVKDGAGTLELAAANAYTGTTTISAGTLKLSGAGSFSQTVNSNVTNNAALVVENDDNTTHARSISGTGTITKNLSGKVIFTGTLSHTGVTTVNAGTFAVGAGSTIGDVTGSTGNFVVNAGGNLEINRSNASTFPRAVSGAGSVTVLGGGTTSFNNNLTHTGGTTISGGTLTIGAGSTAGAISGDIVNNANLSFNRSDNHTVANVISGTGNVLKTATTNTTTLSGNNSYSGTTTIGAGSLTAAHANAFGTSAVTVTTAGSAGFTGGITVANNFTLNNANTVGALRNISGNNILSGTAALTAAARINSDLNLLTLNGNISGAFAITFGGVGDTTVAGSLTNLTNLTKDGAGTLTLSAVNTYTGTTTISAGTLKLSGVGTVGLSSYIYINTSTLVIENDDNTTIARTTSGNGALTKNLNTKVIFTGTLGHTGVTTVNGGTFAVGAGSTVGDVSGSTGNFVINSGATLEINRSNASTFQRPVSGAGAIVVLGGGTATFSGALTHTGGTTVSGGTMSIGNNGTTGSLTGDIVNNAAVQFNRSDAYTYAGVISGTGNLVKAGNGTTTLSGNNSYSGTTTVSSGTLIIGSANALGTSTVIGAALTTVAVTGGLTVANAFTLNSAGVGSAGALRSLSDSNVFSGVLTLALASSINSDVGLLTLNGNIAGAFALTVGGAGNTVINGVLTNPTTLTKSGAGTLELTAVNTYTSTTTISAGTLKLTGVGTVGAGAITNNAAMVVENADNTTIARAISGTGTLTKNLNTKVIFTGALSHTGTTTVTAGTFAVGAGGTVGDMSGAGSVVIDAGTTLEINRSNASTFSRPLSGAGALVVLGGGTASITGALTHTGGTTVSGGTMSIGAGSPSTGSITGNIVNNAAVQFSRSDAYTYSGTISGTGNLVKTQAGTLTLTGNSSYSGTTTISAGVLRVGHANALGSATSTVSVGLGLALELTGGISFARNLSAASTGVSSGGALRNISGDNTFAGNYTLTATSRINSDAGTLTLSSLGTLTGTFALTLGGAGNITVQRPIATSAGALTKDGAGTTVLSAANTYTGVTTISGGTLHFALASALYNGTTASWVKTNIIVNTGSTFAINVGGTNEFTTTNVGTLLTNLLTSINNNGLRSGSAIGFDTTNSAGDFTISSNIVNSTGTGAGAVGVVKLGTGVLVLSGSNTYSGGTTISGGTLRAGNATCFGTGTITVNAGATLDKAGFNITNTIVNNGGTVIN